MRTIDLSPLYRSFIGSEQLAHMLEHASRSEKQTSYPPYNIELIGEDKYRVTMAVAGFGKDDIDIEVVENRLVIKGNKAKDEQEAQREFLHKGISARNFERSFQLGENVKVRTADLQHGLLHIDLERIIPEEKKPMRIEIGAQLIDS